MTDERRTFGRTVALGLVSAGLSAYAGTRTWFVDAAGHGPGSGPIDAVADAGTSPLAAPLALVVLAGWGVVLVTRGWVRRAVAGLALLAALAVVATVVVGFLTLPDAVEAAVQQLAVPAYIARSVTTPWFWLAALAGPVSVVATALAVVWCPRWPEMGSRYDAPGAGREPSPGEDRSSLDLWKSMDEGRDPTA